MILALGLLCALSGLLTLVACFTRLDSPGITARFAGNEEKIAAVHSLQAAWDQLGKTRRFFTSSCSYLIMAVGLILLWLNKDIAKYYWAVLFLYAMNLIILIQIKRYADTVFDAKSTGQFQVLLTIKLQMGVCFLFSILFALLATRV